MPMQYKNRAEAGDFLASRLQHLVGRDDVVVLALPRGGVPVAAEIARILRAPLDVFIVRKLGVPFQPELAMGAIASGGVRVLNDDVLEHHDIGKDIVDEVAAEELREIRRREWEYRRGSEPHPIEGKTVVVVDDGLATGATMRAAVRALRRQNPARIVVAVPVGAADTCAQLEADADEVICGQRPEDLNSVGRWYRDFTQVTDEEVCRILAHTNPTESKATKEEAPVSPGNLR